MTCAPRGYSLSELEALPTLSVSQTDDLKIENKTSGFRVWLARTGVDDGEPFDNKVTVECYDWVSRLWIVTEEYPALEVGAFGDVLQFPKKRSILTLPLFAGVAIGAVIIGILTGKK